MSGSLLFILSALATIGCYAGKENIGVKIIGEGFQRPVWAEAPNGIKNQLWILEKTGKIKILNVLSGQKSLFLDVTANITSKSNEQGLLGIAFEQNYLTNGRFYLYYTNSEGDTEICRYTAHSDDKRSCNSSTRELLLTFKQDYKNHNGGWIGIGPDGHLYVATGDGGAANDPKRRAQNLDSYLGKLLRLDVSQKKGYKIPKDNPFSGNPKVKPEIYAYGLRNPWRCSWDSLNGDFYIADVGQNKWEEINYIPAGEGKGANYGWRLREGAIATPKKGVGGNRPKKSIEPIYVYPHDNSELGGLSVTGGYVYRGPIKSLQGHYFFADYVKPNIWSFEVKNGQTSNFTNWSKRLSPTNGEITTITSFGQDADGNLLIISDSGIIYQIVESSL